MKMLSSEMILQFKDPDLGEAARKPRITRNQRQAANARERSRMMVLSKAFNKLKSKLPWVPPDTKLSKLDTLNLASNYIAHLTKLLESSKNSDNDRINGKITSMVWPNSKFRCRTNGKCQIDDRCDCLERNLIGVQLTSNRKRRYDAEDHIYDLTDYSNLEMD